MVSKIGKIPVIISPAVNCEVEAGSLKVAGPKGNLIVSIPQGIDVSVRDGKVIITAGDSKSSLHGLIRTLVSNAIVGVSTGWSRSLELVGTGYRVALQGENLAISVGFSHQVFVVPQPGIKFTVDQNKIIVNGIDKELVGKTAASIRSIREPEPYKGKGIKYSEEKVRRKAGKAAKAAGAK